MFLCINPTLLWLFVLNAPTRVCLLSAHWPNTERCICRPPWSGAAFIVAFDWPSVSRVGEHVWKENRYCKEQDEELRSDISSSERETKETQHRFQVHVFIRVWSRSCGERRRLRAVYLSAVIRVVPVNSRRKILQESLSLESCRRWETETGEVVFLHRLHPLGFHAPPPARLS